MKARVQVTTLNSTWASASRWPLRLPPREPTKAVVTLLPTLEPMAMARPWPSSSWPLASAARVNIRVAWLDCSTTVTRRPSRANNRLPASPSAW
ncbi:hypothetical protein D3C76_1201680 [compost metagenome]